MRYKSLTIKIFGILLAIVLPIPAIPAGAVPAFAGSHVSSEQVMPVSPGLEYRSVYYDDNGNRNAVNIFDIDISAGAQVQLGITDPLHRLTTTLTQAQRLHSDKNWVGGAINGAFNEVDGSGMPATMIIKNNRLVHQGRLSEARDGYNFFRNAFGVDKNGRPRIDGYDLDVEFIHNDKAYKVSRTNGFRQTNQLTLYTPAHKHSTVGVNPSIYATEIVVANAGLDTSGLPIGKTVTGTVKEVIPFGKEANANIPSDGFVVSGNGREWEEKLKAIRPGDTVSLQVSLDEKWKDAQFLIQTGPRLVVDGQVNISMDETSIQARSRHPRSAVALNRDGSRVFLVTVDGRQSDYSRGMTLKEFAELLVSRGAYQAINLDGGGSTTAILNVPGTAEKYVANSPSDGRLRGVSTSLLAVSHSGAVFSPGQKRVIDPVEKTGSWNTSSVRGTSSLSISRAPNPVRIGDNSFRLKYDFTKSAPGVSAAYLNTNHHLIIPGEPVEIGAWIFGDGGENWLRGTILDRNRNPVVIDFTRDGELDWNGWRYVRARIPSDIGYPVSLQRIYIAQTREERKTAGTIYIDQLEAIYDSSYWVQRFTDVSLDHWAVDNIEFLNEQNIISGYYDGSFKPNRKLSRAHAAIMLVKHLDLETSGRSPALFRDVSKENPYHDAIAAVAAKGIMIGKEPGMFKPDVPLTRAEMAVILDRAYSLSARETNREDLAGFSDVTEQHWAAVSIGSLSAEGITGGYPDGTYKPSKELSRAEFASFMSRIIESYDK